MERIISLFLTIDKISFITFNNGGRLQARVGKKNGGSQEYTYRKLLVALPPSSKKQREKERHNRKCYLANS